MYSMNTVFQIYLFPLRRLVAQAAFQLIFSRVRWRPLIFFHCKLDKLGLRGARLVYKGIIMVEQAWTA